MNRKTLVIMAGAIMLIALFALTFAPVQQVAAQSPTATPVPPVAKLTVVGIPANAALPNAITATLSYITDTAVGAAKTNVAVSTSGLSNVPINVPVSLQVAAVDPKNTGTPTWSLTAPSGSKATITGTMFARFTPDVVGAYMVSVSLKGPNGTSNTEFAFFNAGTYLGDDATNCKTCHGTKVTEWAKTPHSHIFSDEIDNKLTPNVDTHYTENCARCHTVGYFLPAANNGGFTDAEAKNNWKFPTWAQINAAGKKTGPSNFDAAPADVKAMANIQCENCHGPASEHVKTGANVMAVSFKNDVCNACHAGGGTHIKGLEEAFSKHTTGASFEEVTGPSEQACQRCHSGAGFASFVANPTNPAAWDSMDTSYIGCSACHDPHSDANYAQLRIVGKPVAVPFQGAKDVGLSGICETCHNNRSSSGDDYVKAAPGNSTPHYSSAAEMLTGVGGYTYGQTIPDSPHGMMVGAAPVPNPATPGTFLWSASTDTKGNVPGPCVYCHMYPTTAMTDTNYMKVGDHSFNTVSPDGKTDYTAACKSCHGVLPDFNVKAKADYDGNGKVEGDQDEIKGLLNATWKALEAKGFKKVQTGYPYATTPTGADLTASLKGAWYNYRYIYGTMWSADGEGNQGAASAVHNFKRSCALLQLSLKDLGALPAGAADCTKAQ